MAEADKDDAEIGIKQPHQPGAFPEVADDDAIGDRSARLFGPFSQKHKNTWIISLFVILHMVAFTATMFVNDCWRNSHGECVFKALGRLSFQPLSENPLLGPSASTLDEMGALRQSFIREKHQIWRLFTSIWLHGGSVHIIINMSSLIFVGIHLEQEFGALRIGLTYMLSSITGSLTAAIFVRNFPSVASSGGLFGLLGAALSGVISNWGYYTDKAACLWIVMAVAGGNMGMGLLPYVDNFSNVGGMVSGVLLGFILLFNPRLGREEEGMHTNKAGLFDYGPKKKTTSLKLKQQLDRPILRTTSLVLFALLFAAGIGSVMHGLDGSRYCPRCHYIDCLPSHWWVCNDNGSPCERMVSVDEDEVTVTCMDNGRYKVVPHANVSSSRLRDVCCLLCSN